MGGDSRKLQDQQNQAYAEQQAALTQAQQVSPLQQKYEQDQLNFLNWDDSNGKDVGAAPGLGDYIKIGQAAQNRAQQQRMGTGALALGDPGASGYTTNLASLRQGEAAQNFGTGLENALAARKSEATGSVLPLANLDNSRNMGVLGATDSMNASYLNRPIQTPWWQVLMNGAQKAAGAYAGGG